MKINEVIRQVQKLYKGGFDPVLSRDQILYGDPAQECTGVVTTIYASVDVIREAKESGYNLIICHEALFWNHGDHTEWLKETNNRTYRQKTLLLEDGRITVWRCHDWIHSGMKTPYGICDGIFYGLMHYLGYAKEYAEAGGGLTSCISVPEIPLKDLCEKIRNTCGIHAVRAVGDPDTAVRTLRIGFHIWGIPEDNALITETDRKCTDCILAGETTDFTVLEYIRDSALCGRKIALIAPGHFNIEEPGMRYMAELLPEVLPADLPVHFISARDMYFFL